MLHPPSGYDVTVNGTRRERIPIRMAWAVAVVRRRRMFPTYPARVGTSACLGQNRSFLGDDLDLEPGCTVRSAPVKRQRVDGLVEGLAVADGPVVLAEGAGDCTDVVTLNGPVMGCTRSPGRGGELPRVPQAGGEQPCRM